MWVTTCIEGERGAMYISQDANSTVVKLFASNTFWREEITHVTLIERCQQLNHHMQFTSLSIDLIGNKIMCFFKEQSVCGNKLTKQDDDSVRTIRLTTTFSGIPFAFEFYLKLADVHPDFNSDVTSPLFTYIHHLETKQKSLLEIIKKKDKALNQYMSFNGDSIARKFDAETFDEHTFLENKEVSPTMEECMISFITAHEVTKEMEQNREVVSLARASPAAPGASQGIASGSRTNDNNIAEPPKVLPPPMEEPVAVEVGLRKTEVAPRPKIMKMSAGRKKLNL